MTIILSRNATPKSGVLQGTTSLIEQLKMNKLDEINKTI